MGKRIRKKNKEGLEISLEGMMGAVAKSVDNVLGFASDLKRQGKSFHEEQGEITGKTRSGKEIKGSYGFRMRVGLNSPFDHKGRQNKA